jgi:uncharacterized membrane protein YdjX (TVP38/TMEM64 family)
MIAGHPTLGIINAIIREEGWKFAFLVRLNPLIPYQFLNLACSVTDLSFSDNAMACFGTLPIVAFQVCSAASAMDVAMSTGEHGPRNISDYMIGVNAAALCLILAMMFYAKRKFDSKVRAASVNGHSANVSLAPEAVAEAL